MQLILPTQQGQISRSSYFIQWDSDYMIRLFFIFILRHQQKNEDAAFVKMNFSQKAWFYFFIYFIFHIFFTSPINYMFALCNFVPLFLNDQKYMMKFLACVCISSLVYIQTKRNNLNFSFLTALTLYSLLSYNQVSSLFHSLPGSSMQQ